MKVSEVNEVKRRRKQLLYDLKNRRRYWELKKEAELRKVKRIIIIIIIIIIIKKYIPQVKESANE